jgi:DNA invertase Pin-like site-specific DNA recombinase
MKIGYARVSTEEQNLGEREGNLRKIGGSLAILSQRQIASGRRHIDRA